jgi:hypothetical protein
MKKIQNEYERKIRVNANHDVFTTFQRHSNADHSPHMPSRRNRETEQHTQHEHIESLKSTLKSLVPVSMEITKQFSRAGQLSVSEERLEFSQD